MPTAAEHLAKYDANRKLLDSGNGGTPLSTFDPCWASTVAFYAAIHLVERLAVRSGIRNRDHAERMAYVIQDHPKIKGAYKILYDASRTARYLSIARYAAFYPGDSAQKYHIDTYLKQIENYCFMVQPK